MAHIDKCHTKTTSVAQISHILGQTEYEYLYNRRKNTITVGGY